MKRRIIFAIVVTAVVIVTTVTLLRHPVDQHPVDQSADWHPDAITLAAVQAAIAVELAQMKEAQEQSQRELLAAEASGDEKAIKEALDRSDRAFFNACITEQQAEDLAIEKQLEREQSIEAKETFERRAWARQIDEERECSDDDNIDKNAGDEDTGDGE